MRANIDVLPKTTPMLAYQQVSWAGEEELAFAKVKEMSRSIVSRIVFSSTSLEPFVLIYETANTCRYNYSLSLKTYYPLFRSLENIMRTRKKFKATLKKSR